jgi:tetratricopeptide (TPR) repeat protein
VAEDKTVLIKTAYSYYQKGDWDRAIEEYHKLAELDSKDLNVHNMLADIYAKKGDVQEALQQYDLVAQGFDQKNQVDKVLQVYKRMLKLLPNDPELLNAVKNLIDKYLSRAAQVEETEPDKALEIYRSVLKAEPNRIDVNILFAKLLSQKGQKFEGVEALMNLTMNLDEETQTGKLVEVLQAATELDPLNIEAREKIISLFIKAKKTSAAMKSLQDLIEIYISKNDFSKAEIAAQKSIQLGDQTTFYHLGVVFFNQQKYAESRSAFVEFLKQQQGHVGALKYLALAYLRLNQTPEAVQAYLRILDVYFNENLLDEAREVRQTILELDANNEAVAKYPLDQNVLVPEAPAEDSVPAAPTAEDNARLEMEEHQGFLVQAQVFTDRGLYEQAIDVYLDMLKRWPQSPEVRTRLQQVYALVARAMEPAEKHPSAEEIKSELEKELREQMRQELEAQSRAVQERQREMEHKQELDQMRLRQELESKLLEQVQKSKEEELRQKITNEFEEKQKLLTVERDRIEKEKTEAMILAQANRSKEEELRQQFTREFEEKEMRLSLERERIEKERSESLGRLQTELEEAKSSLESNIRNQVEKEMQERAERESQLKEALRQGEEKQHREEEERKKYTEQKKEQEAAKAKINQEIMQGMERLRFEKEKEGRAGAASVTPKSFSNPSPALSPAPAQSYETQESLDDPFVRQTLAEIYAKQGLYLEALKIYERILTEEPHNEDVREKLRDILRLKGI